MGFFSKLMAFFRGSTDQIGSRIELITEYGNGNYVWNGKLYQSDIIRSCIRPKAQAIGKIEAHHNYNNQIDKRPYIKAILDRPNPFMTGQMLQEKMTNQLALNGNAFALVMRDSRTGKPYEIFPISAASAEALYTKEGNLCIRFYMLNGKTFTFAYEDIIHLRRDFYGQDIFGESQAGALAQLMNCVGSLDTGIVKAIKHSGMIRWLLKQPSATRDEDTKAAAKKFAETYLSTESESIGVAAVNAKSDVTPIEPKDIMPNEKIYQSLIDRVYSFFGTNSKIVTSSFNDDEWNSYYNAEIEPLVKQMSEVWTIRLFSLKEIASGNKIVFSGMNLQYASLATKLQLTSFFDRGILNANEIREAMNLPAIPDGDTYFIRKDTGTVGEQINAGGGENNEESTD